MRRRGKVDKDVCTCGKIWTLKELYRYTHIQTLGHKHTHSTRTNEQTNTQINIQSIISFVIIFNSAGLKTNRKTPEIMIMSKIIINDKNDNDDKKEKMVNKINNDKENNDNDKYNNVENKQTITTQ